MAKETFEKYFEGFQCYDEGGKADQGIISDAKKLYEALKNPEDIKKFKDADYKEQEKIITDLDRHSGLSFSLVCKCAYDYAVYAQKFELKDKHPELVKVMKDTKDVNGNAVFSDGEIDDFINEFYRILLSLKRRFPRQVHRLQKPSDFFQ